MSLWLFALGILALLLEARPSCSITHNAQVDAYVKKLIVEFKTDPRSSRYDNVISPPIAGKLRQLEKKEERTQITD